jgi:hypothetical protein
MKINASDNSKVRATSLESPPKVGVLVGIGIRDSAISENNLPIIVSYNGLSKIYLATARSYLVVLDLID